MPVYDEWRRIYGDQLGYSPEYQEELFQQGAGDINREYAGIQRQATTGLAQRGFYSGRPVQRMMGQMGAEKTQALTKYRQGIQQSSEQLAQQQKGRLFGATAQESMLEQQQRYTIQNMTLQQKFDLARMAQQFDNDKDLMKLRKSLESKGWGHLLGTIAGGLAGSFLGGAGAAAGANLGGRIGGG